MSVLTDDNSSMTIMEDETEDIGILSTDQGLEPFKDHFKYRMKRYVDQKLLFEKHEGGLEEFAKGSIYIAIVLFSLLLTHFLKMTWSTLA